MENERKRILGDAEQQLIEQAKRDIEIEAIPEDKREGLQKQIDELRTSSLQDNQSAEGSMSVGDILDISPLSLEIVFAIGQNNNNRMTFQSTLVGRYYSINDWSISDKENKRVFAKFKSAAEELERLDYITRIMDKPRAYCLF